MFVIALASSYAVALLLSLAFEIPVMNVDKILFGGSNSKRKPKPINETTEGQNGKKTSVELGHSQTPNNDEIEENGIRVSEQQEPLMLSKDKVMA